MYFKKTAALLLAATMIVTAAGCSSKDLSWAAQLGDEKISAGVYVLNIMSGLNAASQKVGAGASDFMAGEIDGKPAADFVKDFARDETIRQLATNQKFVALGLSLSDADKKGYEDYAKQMYAQETDMYKANGVSEQTLIDFNRYSYQAYQVFIATYTGTGEKAATAEEMAKYFSDTYYMAYVVPYLKVDGATGAPLDDAALKAVSDQVAAAMAEIEGGKNITDIIHAVGTAQMPAGTEAPAKGEDSDYIMAIEKVDTGYFPAAITAYLPTAEVGKLSKVEDEQFQLIVQKLDETKPDAKLAEFYYSQALPQMKNEEYNALSLEWGNAAGITWNDAALTHYTGTKVKKETDAYRKAAEAAASSAAAASAAAAASDTAQSIIDAAASAVGITNTSGASDTAPTSESSSAPAASDSASSK